MIWNLFSDVPWSIKVHRTRMFCGFMTSCQVRINFFQGNTDASRLRAVISAGYPDLPQGFPSPGHPSNASVRRHPCHMSEPINSFQFGVAVALL